MKWTVAAMASVMAVCVGARRAGLELCVTRRPATHCAARTECVRRGSVSVTRDGQGSTAISVSGTHTHTHTHNSEKCLRWEHVLQNNIHRIYTSK